MQHVFMRLMIARNGGDDGSESTHHATLQRSHIVCVASSQLNDGYDVRRDGIDDGHLGALRSETKNVLQVVG